ncbi:MAG: lysophospholipid acyltransferase family protein [Pseudomonadota bacterium]
MTRKPTPADAALRDPWSLRAGEWVLYAMAWMFRWISRAFSTWAVAGVMAPIGGFLAASIPAWRRRAEANMALVWPEIDGSTRRDLVRDAGAEFTRLSVEYAHLDRFAGEMVLKVTGAEHLDTAREAGKGAILVSAHYGNWEAARLAAKQVGVETGIIYRAFNNRYLDRFTLNLIPIAGEPVLQKGRQGMRHLVTHVAQGGAVMVLVDQRNSGAPFIDFMGHPAETVTAAAELAQRTGAALIPVVGRRNVVERRFDVTFEQPVPPGDPQDMMREVNARISSWIEAEPAQWFWFHRRWRTTTRSRPKPTDQTKGAVSSR